MKTFVQQIEELSSACFAIEKQLPIFHFTTVDTLSDEQYLRKELYRIRCDIATLKRWAQMADNPPSEITLDDLEDADIPDLGISDELIDEVLSKA